jgi:hypothetical protein
MRRRRHLFIAALALTFPASVGLAAEAPEMDIPSDMRDPVGLVPAKEAAVILRGWLELDDWYVQTVAVIRLKELGQTLKPEELQRFFWAAALCNGADLKLVRRALDALTHQEARDGVGLLLKADCRWAAPYAIRFDTPGTSEWLREDVRRLLVVGNQSTGTTSGGPIHLLIVFFRRFEFGESCDCRQDVRLRKMPANDAVNTACQSESPRWRPALFKPSSACRNRAPPRNGP